MLGRLASACPEAPSPILGADGWKLITETVWGLSEVGIPKDGTGKDFLWDFAPLAESLLAPY